MKGMIWLKSNVGSLRNEKALVTLIFLVQMLKLLCRVFGLTNTGLDGLLTFLEDTGVAIELCDIVLKVVGTIILLLSTISKPIDLAQKFATSNLGQTVTKLLQKHPFFPRKDKAILNRCVPWFKIQN